MSISAEAIVKRLAAQFPDGIIYKNDYKLAVIGVDTDYAIHKAAKAEGVTRVQWLKAHGFDWRETGYVEPDMRPHNVVIDNSSAYTLANSVIERYPLAGQYDPSPEEMKMLMTTAQNVFEKLTKEHPTITRAEQMILTFTTVQLLKKWSSDETDDAGTSHFWDFIYIQYGFNPDDAEVATQRIYSRFRSAIESTFTKRYMASEGHRFYSTMLLHALAPEQSIFNLYDVLFNFYIKNLDYQYEPEDPIYDAFVKGMQNRWDREVEKEGSLELRSSVVTVGLKTLFQNRPGYMAKVCDCLVKNIDRLVREEPWQSQNRWDDLLKTWFDEKSHAEKSQIRSEKRHHHTEFVATTADRIFVRYALENGRVGLLIPQIRLVSEGQSSPLLRVRQGKTEVYSQTMKTSGNELGRTTKRLFLPLKETEIDFSANLDICAEIEYAGESLYTSGSKLIRKYILFDYSGAERDVRKGMAYLFANESCCFDFFNDEDVLQENHPGQLLRLNLDQVGAVTINGTEIFADEQQAGKLRLYPSRRPINSFWISAEGKRTQIFDEEFEVILRIPENDNRLRYKLFIDGEPLAYIVDRSTKDEVVFPAGNSQLPYAVHTISVRDLATSSTVLEYSFTILPGIRLSLSKSAYIDTENSAVLTVTDGDSEIGLPAIRIEGSDIAETTATYCGLVFGAELPVIHADMGGTSLFDLPSMLWYESIEKSDYVRLRLPDGWKGKLMLGVDCIEPNANGIIELGNYLRSGRTFEVCQRLWLSLRSNQGAEDPISFTELVFEPMFSGPPLFAERGHLNWIPENSFFGTEDSKFTVSISGKKSFTFDVTTKNCGLTRMDDGCRGIYQYTVSMTSSGLFSKGATREIYSGEFIHGNIDELRFEGKEIILTSAIYWDMKKESLESAHMRLGAGVLVDLEYVGNSSPSGETLMFPEYDATLAFETADGRRIPFSYDEENEDYEWLNPVRVWIINDQRLILRGVTDDAVYFDTQYNSIVNRNPNRTMTPAAQRNRLQNPDYFEYIAKER